MGGGIDYEKFLLGSIFPTRLTEFPAKLTELVPFIFNKPILPDCQPNYLVIYVIQTKSYIVFTARAFFFLYS